MRDAWQREGTVSAILRVTQAGRLHLECEFSVIMIDRNGKSLIII